MNGGGLKGTMERVMCSGVREQRACGHRTAVWLASEWRWGAELLQSNCAGVREQWACWIGVRLRVAGIRGAVMPLCGAEVLLSAPQDGQLSRRHKEREERKPRVTSLKGTHNMVGA